MELSLPTHITLAQVAAVDLPLATNELTNEERLRQATFGSVSRRQSYALGRLAARQALADRCASARDKIDLRVAEDGALDVIGLPLHVSISHSGEMAVAAASPEAVGVDLEMIKPRPQTLFRFMLHPEELDVPRALPYDPDVTLALLWTIKESVLKALRTGLRQSPKTLRLGSFDRPNQIIVSDEDASSWYVRYLVGNDHTFAVASRQ